MSTSGISEEIRKAIGAHGAWKLRLKTAVTLKRTDLEPATVKCDDKCEFGKWLHGSSLNDEVKSGMPYKVTTRLHAEFHECASKVVERVIYKDTNGASAILEGEYAQRSDKLMRALNKWRREL